MISASISGPLEFVNNHWKPYQPYSKHYELIRYKIRICTTWAVYSLRFRFMCRQSTFPIYDI